MGQNSLDKTLKFLAGGVLGFVGLYYLTKDSKTKKQVKIK